MSETRTVRDPFLGKDVEISNRLVDRLRGRYAVGPMLSNGEPEFGWRYHETPPIQKEAAGVIIGMFADLRVFEDLAVAADTAELMLRKEFPAAAQSLYAKVKAAKAILDVALNRPAALCPRCSVEKADPVLLGSAEEGHICGKCWVEDRSKDDKEDVT